MSKTEKLLTKLKNGSISASELRTLLGKLGWELRNQVGSHEQWVCDDKRFTIATHGKDLPPYQVKMIRKILEDK